MSQMVKSLASLAAQTVKSLLQCGRLGFDAWWGRSPGEGKVAWSGNPLQYSYLENPTDRGA